MGHEFPPDTLSAVPGEWINWCSSVTSVLERSRSTFRTRSSASFQSGSLRNTGSWPARSSTPRDALGQGTSHLESLLNGKQRYAFVARDPLVAGFLRGKEEDAWQKLSMTSYPKGTSGTTIDTKAPAGLTSCTPSRSTTIDTGSPLTGSDASRQTALPTMPGKSVSSAHHA